MYAQVLRKWSLTKIQMYLWLIPVIMLLVICCQNASAMHLNGLHIRNPSSIILDNRLPSTQLPVTLHRNSIAGGGIKNENQRYGSVSATRTTSIIPIDNIFANDSSSTSLNEQQTENLLPILIKIDHNSASSSSNFDEQSIIINKTNNNNSNNYDNNNNINNNNKNNDKEIIFNASTNVPNLNSQINNLKINNIINNNNNNLNSLTSSANIDTLSSNYYLNNHSRNHKKFRRHITTTTTTTNHQQTKSLLTPRNIAQAQHTDKDIDRNLMLPATFNQQQTNLLQQNQQLQYFFEQRERRARIKAHRQHLIKLNQLSSSSSSSSSSVQQQVSNSKITRLLPVKNLDFYATAKEEQEENHENQLIVPKIYEKNLSTVDLIGRNRRDSRAFPLHLSSVPSATSVVVGSSSSTMLSSPPSHSVSYPSYQSNGYYRQQINNQQQQQQQNVYQHYNTNNNYNQQQRQQQQQQQQYNPNVHNNYQQQNQYNYNNQLQHQQQQYNVNYNQHYNQMQQHHQHHQQQQQQQQQRKRPRRYCSARDPAQLAFEAPTVFEGKIISMSYDRRANFSVTFEVKEIFKKQIGSILPSLLRLQFQYRNSSGECDIYREHLRPRGLVRNNELEQGRIYILFVQQIDLGNFTILGQPIRKTKRAVNSVRKGVSENYAQPAFIRSLTAIVNDKRIDSNSDKRIKNGEELRIICRVSGQPPPKVTWFKDDKSINRNRKLYQFVHLKKRSELIIRSFNSTDAGVYECRAKNKNFRKPERKIIRIEAVPRITYETSSQQSGDECTHDMQIYCLNGGTCKYFKEIHDFSCECPDGFYGDRCQEKQWNETPNPTYKTGYMADDPSTFEMTSSDEHKNDSAAAAADASIEDLLNAKNNHSISKRTVI